MRDHTVARGILAEYFVKQSPVLSPPTDGAMKRGLRRIRGAVGMGLAWAAGSATSVWQALAVVGGPFILLSAASAAGTLLIARQVPRRDHDASFP